MHIQRPERLESLKRFTLILDNGTAIEVMGTQPQIDKVRGMMIALPADWVNLQYYEEGVTEYTKRFTCLPKHITGIIYSKDS